MRILSVGNVVADLLAEVPVVPRPGEDVTAASSGVSAGGAFNTLVAARRQGLEAVYGGAHGTGPFGNLVRSHLEREDIGVLQPPVPDVDTGWDVALTDAAGERTFNTTVGAEAQQCHTPERCNVESKGTRSIFGKEDLQRLCLRQGRHPRQVARLERDRDLVQDLLQRSLQSFPTKPGAQDRVLFRNPAPGLSEAMGVDRLIEPYLELLDIHARSSSLDVMKQHSLLERRERITILNHGTPRSPRAIAGIAESSRRGPIGVIVTAKKQTLDYDCYSRFDRKRFKKRGLARGRKRCLQIYLTVDVF